MAAKYRKIDPRVWNDEKFRTLAPSEKLVALYAITAQSNRCGIFSFSPARGSEETGITPSAFGRAFNAVVERLRWRWDPKNRVLYMPSWWKYNEPHNDDHLTGCLTDLDDLPDTLLLKEFVENLQYLPERSHGVFHRGVRDVVHSVADSVPQQKQEQEQEQKQNQNSPPSPLKPDRETTPPG